MKDRTTFDNARLLRQLSEIEPPPEVVQRALERTREALTICPLPARDVAQENWRHPSRHALGVAAAIAAVLVVAAGGAYLLFFATSGVASAFAQVQFAIAHVPCVACSVEWITVPKGIVAKPGTSVTDIAGNRWRCESADGTEVLVNDSRRGMSMQLFPPQKRAVILRRSSWSEPSSFANLLKGLQYCNADEVEQLEDGDLDGRTVERYRVLPESPLSGGVEMLVSVDPQTHLPVRIESTTDKLGGLLHVVCKDFSYDERDPSLFAMVPPEGYQVETYQEGEPHVLEVQEVDESWQDADSLD